MIKNMNYSVEYKRNPQQQLAEYQKNMKIFISGVEKQMASIIDKYENRIKELMNQNARLKNQLNKRNAKLDVSEQLSPIKFKSDVMASIKKTSSNFMEDFPMKTFLGLDSKIQNTQNTYRKMPSFDYKFQIQSTPDKLSKSRFEAAKTSSKQKQQELIQSLQTGKINLQESTIKMFQLVGRTSRQQEETTQNQQADEKDENSKKRKVSQKLNSSLSSICQSLDNSFHGKRAQAKSEKKRKQKNAKEQQEKKKQYESQKKRKQQGLKNLLTSMRKNIDSSPQKPPQIIKGSKLLTTGVKNSSVQLSKAKVMINPVPVDISNRNKIKQQNTTQTSPSKNPTSILKNSGSNFFSKSIENISAISFVHDTSVYE